MMNLNVSVSDSEQTAVVSRCFRLEFMKVQEERRERRLRGLVKASVLKPPRKSCDSKSFRPREKGGGAPSCEKPLISLMARFKRAVFPAGGGARDLFTGRPVICRLFLQIRECSSAEGARISKSAPRRCNEFQVHYNRSITLAYTNT